MLLHPPRILLYRDAVTGSVPLSVIISTSVSSGRLHHDRNGFRKSMSRVWGSETNWFEQVGSLMLSLESVWRNGYFERKISSPGWESLCVAELVQFQPQDRVSQRLYQDVARLIERSFKREGRELLDRSVNHYPEARLLLRHTRPRL